MGRAAAPLLFLVCDLGALSASWRSELVVSGCRRQGPNTETRDRFLRTLFFERRALPEALRNLPGFAIPTWKQTGLPDCFLIGRRFNAGKCCRDCEPLKFDGRSLWQQLCQVPPPHPPTASKTHNHKKQGHKKPHTVL